MKITGTKILITGGAGFIGTKLALRLAASGAEVVVFDCLSEQIHGQSPMPPMAFEGRIKFVLGNVLNYNELRIVLEDADVVIHLAAETGVGQSMYEVAHYSKTNVIGTANILDILTNTPNGVKKLILASSRAIYGEGCYNCDVCGRVYPKSKEENRDPDNHWELKCPICRGRVIPLAIDESSVSNPESVYAANKYSQEGLVEVIGSALKIPYTVLRFFNVYGEGQALNNPYTGILSVFATRILNNRPLMIFEDGLMSRDFVYIEDVVSSIILSLEQEKSNYQIYNVGSGERLTILDLANIMLDAFNSEVEIEITGLSRFGDIRHAIADISKISTELGYSPSFSFREGIKRYQIWMRGQETVSDHSEMALEELRLRKLLNETV